MGLREDDLLVGLQMAAPADTRGIYLPGHGTDVHLGHGATAAEGRMVAAHEAAHLELNLTTAYGALLRSLGNDLVADATTQAVRERLAGFVDQCRTTHEVCATTLGVWAAAEDFEEALAAYPQYVQFFEAGRRLAGGLDDGSNLAVIAVKSACRVAMQAPLGATLLRDGGGQTFIEDLPLEFRPDVRLDLLLNAGLDVGRVRVPEPIERGSYHVYDEAANLYYAAFAEALASAGMPTLGPDEAATDPDMLEWLGTTIAPHEPVHARVDADGYDRFWQVSLSDAERVVLDTGRRLLLTHFGDLPALGTPEQFGQDDCVLGPEPDSSVLVVVRPLQTLLKQYTVSEAGVDLLRASAVSGVVTAVRVNLEEATWLGVLSSTRQLVELAALSAHHGVLASVSSSCIGQSDWANYWMPGLLATTYFVTLMDFPRRLWIAALPQEGITQTCFPLVFQREAQSSPLSGLAVEFAEFDGLATPPILIVGSPLTVERLAAVFAELAGTDAWLASTPPSPEEKFIALVQRVVGEEPWFDARSVQDLPRDSS